MPSAVATSFVVGLAVVEATAARQASVNYGAKAAATAQGGVKSEIGERRSLALAG